MTSNGLDTDMVVDGLEEMTIKDYTSNGGDIETAASLTRTIKDVLEEVDTFVDFVSANGKQTKFEHSRFLDMIKNEVSLLKRLQDPSLDPTKLAISIRSSNVPFFKAVWDAAKRSSGITRLRSHQNLVDIVADGGAQWIKVSTITEHRLLHEMAKQGWNFHDSDDSDNEGDAFGFEEKDGGPDIALLKAAETLLPEAKKTRIRYRNPKIIFVLPRIRSGPTAVPEIITFLNRIREMGITIVCSNELPSTPSISEAMPRMLYNELETLSPTLNVDCTILLAIVSDISHGEVEEQPWFNRAIRAQLDAEKEQKLMPSVHWQTMGSRPLVATSEAIARMRKIVSAIGTETEKARTATLLGDNSCTREELIAEFQNHSVHTVPAEWQLPVRQVEAVELDDERLPEVAKHVAKELTPINQSIFLYGWATGLTTITSNRAAVNVIKNTIEKNRTSEEDAGPHAWVCYITRSLACKEKGRVDN